jgi:hypothetical protein
MCERRSDRDDRGRLVKGHTANPRGRRLTPPLLKLVEAAEAAGAEIRITLPARPARTAAPADDLPPAA